MNQFKKENASYFKGFLKNNGLIVDCKGILPKQDQIMRI